MEFQVYKRYYLLLSFLIPYMASCGHSSSSLKKNHPIPLHYSQKGVASWYGKDFHGRKTANGEIYDMYKPTAAHKYLPLGSYIKVTNLNNKRSIVVRVNDRGPFVKGRILDLSYMAARKLDIVEEGLAPIKLEVVKLQSRQKINTFYIQLGAFKEYKNAKTIQKKLSSHYPVHFTKYENYDHQCFYRVRIGPYTKLKPVERMLGKLKNMGFTDSFIVAQ